MTSLCSTFNFSDNPSNRPCQIGPKEWGDKRTQRSRYSSRSTKVQYHTDKPNPHTYEEEWHVFRRFNGIPHNPNDYGYLNEPKNEIKCSHVSPSLPAVQNQCVTSIPQPVVAFKPFHKSSRPFRLMVRTPLFHGGNVGSTPIGVTITHSKTVRFQHPFYRTGRRFSVPACLRQTHHYYHRYLRNVSHLKLHTGDAPTSRSVTIMAGRFFRCRNSLSDFRKIFPESEK